MYVFPAGHSMDVFPAGRSRSSKFSTQTTVSLMVRSLIVIDYIHIWHTVIELNS
jgi:hypothetical protein